MSSLPVNEFLETGLEDELPYQLQRTWRLRTGYLPKAVGVRDERRIGATGSHRESESCSVR